MGEVYDRMVEHVSELSMNNFHSHSAIHRRIFGCAKPGNPHGLNSVHPDGTETTHSLLMKQRAGRKKAKLAAAAGDNETCRQVNYSLLSLWNSPDKNTNINRCSSQSQGFHAIYLSL